MPRRAFYDDDEVGVRCKFGRVPLSCVLMPVFFGGLPALPFFAPLSNLSRRVVAYPPPPRALSPGTFFPVDVRTLTNRAVYKGWSGFTTTVQLDAVIEPLKDQANRLAVGFHKAIVNVAGMKVTFPHLQRFRLVPSSRRCRKEEYGLRESYNCVQPFPPQIPLTTPVFFCRCCCTYVQPGRVDGNHLPQHRHPNREGQQGLHLRPHAPPCVFHGVGVADVAFRHKPRRGPPVNGLEH